MPFTTLIRLKKALLLAAAAAALLPQPARCAWEKIRDSGAPLAVVRASTGAYELSYTVGDDCASPAELANAPSGVWSGYLSLVPAEVVNPGLAAFTSTAAASMEGTLVGMTPGENVNLVFGEELSPALSNPAVGVTQLYDNTGALVNSTWAVTVSYSGQKLVVVPDSSWPKGSVFSVAFSSSLVDVNGSPVSPAATVYFSVIMDHAADNTALAVSDRRVRVSIPANAYAQDFYVKLSTDAALPAVSAANTRMRGQPGAPEFVNTVSVKPYDSAGNLVQPGAACVVTLPYPDEDGDGIIDGSLSRQKVSGLSVWHLDEARGLWDKQAGSQLNAGARTVSQTVTHFSNYALLAVSDADLTPVYAYPVPFRPGGGDPARYGTWAQGITFTNLPAYGRIRIYTVAGDLVRELAVVPPSLKWDLKNSNGQTVASGVYLWEIAADKARKTGKLVVIK
ncbi:MAG: hypothetical protein A2X32_12345 [Elusimicrobia bacterium GWC2_64_44]|nr:MAG: hypothetical protein A2X32_12345 [Elusimicrobia bacterium GWC2_64_44]